MTNWPAATRAFVVSGIVFLAAGSHAFAAANDKPKPVERLVVAHHFVFVSWLSSVVDGTLKGLPGFQSGPARARPMCSGTM